MPRVSVIVPCLNMAEYIGECMDSIVGQTLKDLEILVIDAGSTDGTQEILKGYEKTDGRVHVIHSTKKSYGYQVNLGMEQSTGEYIAIVDADDRVGVNMYATLYERAVQSKADYVKGTARFFCTISETLTYYQPHVQFEKEDYVSGEIELVPADRPDILTKDNFLWSGIFRRDFMEGIRLHESPGAAFQDLGGLLQTQMKARKAVYLEESFYEYRQDNASSSERNSKGFQFVWEEYTWAEQFVKNAPDHWKAAFYRKFFGHALTRYFAMAASGRRWDDARPYIDLIREKLRGKLKSGMIKEKDFPEWEWENLMLFFSDGDKLYDKYSKLYASKRQQMMNIMAAAKGRDIAVFGYGELGRFIHAQALKRGWGRVAAYCDNQTEKQGSLFWGVPVLTPVEAASLHPDACFVAASSRHFEAIKEQLMSMGIPAGQICCYTAGVDMRLWGIALP